MTGDGRRARRVAELIRTHLAELIRRDVDDPSLAALVITDVSVPDDLGVAWVTVKLLLDDDDVALRKKTLRAVGRSAPRLRRKLAPRLGLRRVPDLRFSYDEGHDATRRVDELLREIDGERGEAAEQGAADEQGDE